MTTNLSGLRVEYAIGLLYSSEAGKREATGQRAEKRHEHDTPDAPQEEGRIIATPAAAEGQNRAPPPARSVEDENAGCT